MACHAVTNSSNCPVLIQHLGPLMEREQLFREVAYLRSQRLSIRAIAAKLGVNRGRVERALKAGALPQVPRNQPASPFSYSLTTNIFVGYQRELEDLKACLEDTLRGRENLVMLVGEPGWSLVW